jgi:hypothetical protein
MLQQPPVRPAERPTLALQKGVSGRAGHKANISQLAVKVVAQDGRPGVLGSRALSTTPHHLFQSSWVSTTGEKVPADCFCPIRLIFHLFKAGIWQELLLYPVHSYFIDEISNLIEVPGSGWWVSAGSIYFQPGF